MLRIILNGAGGRMGREVREMLLDGDGSAVLCAQIDKSSPEIVLKNIAEYRDEADVIVDFSHHSAIKELVAYAVGRKMPLVICTTGQTQEEKDLIHEAAKSIPVFFSANMSLGIAVLCSFAKKAAALFPDADIEIVEAHHNRKLDAPSGTAAMIADGIKEVRPDAQCVYGRHGMKQREKNEIGIHSLRMGNEPGMHEVVIATDFQTLRLTHNAESRAVFAEGALTAARFIAGRQPGLYDMNSIVSL